LRAAALSLFADNFFGHTTMHRFSAIAAPMSPQKPLSFLECKLLITLDLLDYKALRSRSVEGNGLVSPDLSQLDTR
jgi:hypothetical protein